MLLRAFLLSFCACQVKGFLFSAWSNSNCDYGKWSKCNISDTGIVRVRFPLSGQTNRVCMTQTQRCKSGTLLGDTFIDNFLQPVEPVRGAVDSVLLPGQSKPGKQPGIGTSRRSWGGSSRRRRRRTVVVTRPPVRVPPQNCVEYRDPDTGDLLMGNCNTQQQRESVSVRGKRSLSTAEQEAQKARQSDLVPQRHRDLLIMMDESGSVGTTKFAKVKKIAAGIVKILCRNIGVRHDLTRVAVISFDSSVHDHIRLDNFSTANKLEAAINGIRYNHRSSGSTCLHEALEYAHNTVFSTARGGRKDDPNVEQDIVLLTDGCANCRRVSGSIEKSLRLTSASLIRDKINVYVIGIGLPHDCKGNMKILAQGGRCYHFFYLGWNTDVDAFIDQLYNPPDDMCLSQWTRQDGQCTV